MILQQALQQVDTQELVQAVCEYHRAADTSAADYDEARCSALVKTYSGFIQALLGLSPRRNGDYVLLPTGRATNTIIAELYRNDEVRTALSNWHLEKIYTRGDLSAFPLSQLQTVYQRGKARQPVVYGYTVMPWTEELAVDVAGPEDFSPAARLQFLASILYEMSFFGVTMEEHRKSMDDLETAAEEARTGQTHPIEELDPDFDLTPSPAKTDDEKRAELIENIITVQHTYQMFRRIYGNEVIL